MKRFRANFPLLLSIALTACGGPDRAAPPPQPAPAAAPSAAPPVRNAPLAPKPEPSQKKRAWYSGGTLHTAKMSAWSGSSYENRLATSSDFVVKLMQMDNMRIPPVAQLRPDAEKMERCISETNTDGVADSQNVSTVAATCWILLK